MSGGGFRRFEMIEPSRFFIKHQTTTIFKPTPLVVLGEEALRFPTPSPLLDLLLLHHPNLIPTPASFHLSSTPSPFEFFDSITDLIQIETENSSSSYILQQQSSVITETDLYLKSLSDRVSALELGLDRFVNAKLKDLDRNYSWTAEIKSPDKDGIDRKYKWTAEIKAAAAGKKKMNEKEEEEEEKNYKWTAEYKGKGKNAPISNTYTFKASTAPPSPKMKKKKKGETAATATRVIQIKEPANEQGALFLKQAFAKRAGAANNGKGKKKELSPQDAAMMIQMSFRAYLIRRSQALRALRELAVAKAKLKELRGLFNNFSYRRRIARDAEEHQKFSEKIIVLLLTVDAIEGADLMVRAARRSMIDELEAMLDVVDPQPAGKLGSMKRRTFDLPNGGIQREIAAGVAEVVQMLDQEEKAGTNTFEVCL